MNSPLTDRQIVISKVINAPRTRVWEAFTSAEHLEKWWGPNGFTITTESFDFRVGGMWKFTMHSPNPPVPGSNVLGGDFEDYVKFTDIVEGEKISHVHGGGEDVEFLADITFADEGGEQTLGKLVAYVEGR